MFARLAVLLSAFLLALSVSSAQARNSHRNGGSNHARRGVFAVEVPDHLRSCDTTTLSWNGTKAPYSLGLLVGKGADAPLYHLGKTNETSYTWEVDLVPNTTVTIAVKGSTGMIAYSRKLVIEDGTYACLPNSTWAPARNTSRYPTPSSSPIVSRPPTTNGSGMGNTSATNGIGNNAGSANTQSGAATQATAGLGLLIAAGLLALVA